MIYRYGASHKKNLTMQIALSNMLIVAVQQNTAG